MTSLLRSLAGALAAPSSPSGGEVSAKIPVPLVGTRPLFADGMSRNADGGDKEAQAGAMGANGTLFAIVGGISFDVSAVEWKLWRRSKSGRKEDREQVTSHPTIELFDQPNPFMPWQEFCETVQQHVELTGEGWPLVSRLLGLPYELWPVYPHRMTPIPSPGEFLSGYVYSSPGGTKIPLGLDEVTQLRQPHPLNLYRGLSAVQAISGELSASRAASAWNDRFFTNSAVPGGIIEQDIEAGALTDTEFRTFTERWRESHQGVNNAHKVAVLEAGMKWIANSYSLRDLQFVELREMSREVVREAYRYPLHYLGTSESVNRANAEAQEVFYSKAILIPRLTRWKSWRNRDILPMFGGDWRSLEWDFEDPTPPDAEKDNATLTAKSTAAKTFVDMGFDGNKVIEALELPATLGTWTKPEPPTPALPPGGGNAPKKKTASSWAPAWALPVNEAGELAELGEAWQVAVDEAVGLWQEQVSPQQADAAAQAVDDAVDSGDLAALAALVVPVLGVGLLTGVMVNMAATAAASVVAEAARQGVAVGRAVVDRGLLEQAAEGTAGLLAQGLSNAAGREALRLYTTSAVGADVARDVRAYLDGLSDRALRDAIGGAMTRAQNAGRLATYAVGLSTGLSLRLYADETLDKNTCLPCREIDGAELPTLDAAQLAYGGAGYLWCEGGVRCRGTVRGEWSRADGT